MDLTKIQPNAKPLSVAGDTFLFSEPSIFNEKKRNDFDQNGLENRGLKKPRIQHYAAPSFDLDLLDANDVCSPMSPTKIGFEDFKENDILSGRGGGTNLHPGNRNFRDLINLHRKSYLQAKKNEKPAISRSIVKSIRQRGGRFLKKDGKSGVWLEIGDAGAREKTSQALRQKAPEMRQLLFSAEREKLRLAVEAQLRQQQLLLGDIGQNMMRSPNVIPGIINTTNDTPSYDMINPAPFLHALPENASFTGS
jgi:hypothetical protein